MLPGHGALKAKHVPMGDPRAGIPAGKLEPFNLKAVLEIFKTM